MNDRRVLRRSRHDYLIAGVCGGLAEYYGLSSTRLRAAYLLCSVLSAAFPGILVYIMLWLLIPRADRYEGG